MMRYHLLELRKLYDEERWSDCFSLLYKHDVQTKSLVWVLITLAYCLDVLFFYLIWHVFDSPTTGTTLIAVVIAAAALAVTATVAALALAAFAGTATAAFAGTIAAAAFAVALAVTATALVRIETFTIAALAVAALAVLATGIDEYLIKKWCQKRTKETEAQKR